MKKIFLLLLILVALGLGAVYYLIPGTLSIATVASINCNRDAAFRKLYDRRAWEPLGIPATALNSTGFSIESILNNAFDIAITQDGKILNSKMVLIPTGKEITILNWECKLSSSKNPLQRVADYRTAVAVKKSMDSLAAKMKAYLSVFSSLYGFPLLETSTKDTLLVITKSVSQGYPNNDFIYSRVNQLSNFCAQQGCSVTGSPMINITPQDQQYQVMVALPVNKTIIAKGDVYPGKMVPGKFIVAKVKGGQKTVENALQQIRLYFQDYGRTSMAIPFSYLITNRQEEPDSTRWITRIYAPVY